MRLKKKEMEERDCLGHALHTVLGGVVSANSALFRILLKMAFNNSEDFRGQDGKGEIMSRANLCLAYTLLIVLELI